MNTDLIICGTWQDVKDLWATWAAWDLRWNSNNHGGVALTMIVNSNSHTQGS